MHQISFWFFQRGITSVKKKKCVSAIFPWGIHIWNFKTLACMVNKIWHACFERMHAQMHGQPEGIQIHCFTFFPYKSIRNQIWPCRKISQGQPKVIIWINLVVLEHQMPHTKFEGHQPFGSREEDFLRFLPYKGMEAILVMWPGPFEQLSFPHPIEAPYEIRLIGPVVSEEKMFKECGWRTTMDGWRRPTYPISSPLSLWLRWAKKLQQVPGRARIPPASANS